MTITELLQAYARGESSLEAVTRGLIEFDEWMVPATYALEATGRQCFDHAQILSHATNFPADELWIYSDQASLQTAVDAGAQLGTYVRPVKGRELFAALGRLKVRALKVNIGCPIEQAWFIGADSFPLIALWAQALTVERALESPASAERNQTLRDFPGYLVLFHAEHDAIATLQNVGGFENPAILFTALDCCEKLHGKHPQLQRRTWSGSELAAQLPDLGVDGVITNPFGPGPALGFSISKLEAMLTA